MECALLVYSKASFCKSVISMHNTSLLLYFSRIAGKCKSLTDQWQMSHSHTEWDLGAHKKSSPDRAQKYARSCLEWRKMSPTFIFTPKLTSTNWEKWEQVRYVLIKCCWWLSFLKCEGFNSTYSYSEASKSSINAFKPPHSQDLPPLARRFSWTLSFESSITSPMYWAIFFITLKCNKRNFVSEETKLLQSSFHNDLINTELPKQNTSEARQVCNSNDDKQSMTQCRTKCLTCKYSDLFKNIGNVILPVLWTYSKSRFSLLYTHYTHSKNQKARKARN